MMQEIMSEINSEYSMAVKKAIVDFALGNSFDKEKMVVIITNERTEVKNLTFRYTHRFIENKKRITKYLFAYNFCLAQILDMWNTKFKGIILVDTKLLAEQREAYDLSDFKVNMGYKSKKSIFYGLNF